jgi:hypothetical protein
MYGERFDIGLDNFSGIEGFCKRFEETVYEPEHLKRTRIIFGYAPECSSLMADFIQALHCLRADDLTLLLSNEFDNHCADEVVAEKNWKFRLDCRLGVGQTNTDEREQPLIIHAPEAMRGTADEDIDHWRSRAQELELANLKLRELLDMARPLEMERLLSYLPALYVQVFSVIGAADLALLTERVEPFAIPSPYPEPSTETLSRKQREFRQLDVKEQARIVHLVSNYAHRLLVRPEMQALLRELRSEP